MLTIAEAADRLKVCTDTIYYWHKTGRISIIFDDPKKRHISLQDVEKMESEKIPAGSKKCSLCGCIDKEELFQPGHSKHIECYKNQNKEKWTAKKVQHSVNRKRAYKKDPSKALKRANNYYKKNRDKVFFQQILKKYNLSEAQYFELLEKCQYKCEICGCISEKLNVDHNHETGEVRGMLCHQCNCGIGHLKDNPVLLEQAINYLKNTKDKTIK